MSQKFSDVIGLAVVECSTPVAKTRISCLAHTTQRVRYAESVRRRISYMLLKNSSCWWRQLLWTSVTGEEAA